MAIGKWHLGHQEEKYRPTANGFDEYYGLLYSNDMTPPWVRTQVPLQLYRNREVVEDPVVQATLTERYTEESLRFITKSKEVPFFLYLAYSVPHVPLFASEKFKGRSRRGLYEDIVETIDWSVGRILEYLGKEGLAQDTLVVFTSDNGPWREKELDGGAAGLLREGKGRTYEGGMREPCVIKWPGHIPAGTVSAEVVTSMDFVPTFLALAGVSPPRGYLLDGKNILPVLQEGAPSPHEAFYYYRGPVLEAMREGKWKVRLGVPREDWITYRDIILQKSRESRRTYTVAGLHQGAIVELFNLEEDPSERFDLAKENPQIVARLLEKMEAFARKLEPGPAFDLTSLGRPKA